MKTNEVDTTAFLEMCDDLAGLTITPFQAVVDYEAARVIEKTIQRIPAASVSKIRGAHESAQFTAQPETLYLPETKSGLRARSQARRLKGNKLLYNLGYRFPDKLWAGIESARKRSLQLKLRARGLAKRSMWKIARMLGLQVRAPGFVTKAEPSDGKNHDAENLSVVKSTSGSRYGIAFENAQPTVNVPGLNVLGILQSAINGRVKYFQTNVKKKVFDSTAAIAKRYPGVKVS